MNMIIINSNLPRIIRKLAIIFPTKSRSDPDKPGPKSPVVIAPVVSKYEL